MSDNPTTPSEPVGYRLGDRVDGRYELVAVLGSGGMATVYRAHDPVLDRDVAVKVFGGAGLANDPAGSARATAEVRILAGLSHPNIVSIFDASGGAPGAFDHLVMELVDGRTLRQRLDSTTEGPLTSREAAALGADLAAGLEYVHERGVVHRDIKPANVLLARTGKGDRAKLADFGVARLLEASPMTMAGTTVGTANYLSPEQATGVEVGPPSDVYSLGLVLLECLTGTMAYPGTGVAAAAARLHRAPFHPTDVDPRWRTLLGSMTALDPSHRADVGRVAAELAALAQAPDDRTVVLPAAARHDGTAVLPLAPPPEPARRRRRGLIALLVAGGVAAVAVVLGIATSGDGTDGSPPAVPGTSATSPVPSTAAASTSAAATTPPRTTAAASTSSRPRTTAAPQPPAGPPGRQQKDDKSPKPGKGKKDGP